MSTLDIAPPRIRIKPSLTLLDVLALYSARGRTVWVSRRLACRKLGPIHSTDRVLWYHGRVEPYRLCGFHQFLGRLTVETPEPRRR